ncbi:hypothetical protein FACS1894164_19840 [Spirochaetia bacterium]|nr:hypothetical protein FACS1894164_19840 [Spirochaetia bacterium]
MLRNVFMRLFPSMAIIVILGILLMGCNTPPQSPTNLGDIRHPGQGESLIIVRRLNKFLGSALTFNVSIDDQIRLSLRNGEKGKVVVPNGTHTIYVEATNGLIILKTQNISFNINSSQITFIAGKLFHAGPVKNLQDYKNASIEMTNGGEIPLNGSDVE